MAEPITLATRVTIARILLVPLFVIAFVQSRDGGLPGVGPAAFGLFVALALSDALDGWLARRARERTELGAFLDPMADKLLVASGFVCLALAGLPAWVPIAIVGREVLVLGGWVLLRLFDRPSHVRPSALGKVTTVSQFALLVLGLWRALIDGAPSLAGDSLVLAASAGVVGLTVVSGLAYLGDARRRFEADVPAARPAPAVRAEKERVA